MWNLGLFFGLEISLPADACRDLAMIRLAKKYRKGAPQGRYWCMLCGRNSANCYVGNHTRAEEKDHCREMA